MLKVLHIADLHFRSQWLELMVECFPTIIDAAQLADVVVVTGDVYDGPMPLDSEPVRTCRRFFSELSEVAPVLVVRGTFTHDRNQLYHLTDINSPAIMVVDEPGVAVLKGQDRRLVWCGENYKYMMKAGASSPLDNLVIGCLPEPPKVVETEHANGLIQAICAGYRAAAPEDSPLVIAGHLGVSGSELSNQSILGQYVARSVLEAADCPVFLGHIHKPQKIGKQIFYAGSPWPLNYGENHLHGFYIHYLMAEGTMESTFVECSQRKIVPITIDLRTDAKINLGDVLKSRAEEIKSNLVYLKLWPGPTDSSRLQAEAETILQRIAPYDFKIEVLREDTVVVRSPEIATAKTLRQKIQVISPEAPESVLEKADILEQESPEKLERQVQEL